VLTAPGETYVRERPKRSRGLDRTPRRDFVEDLSDTEEDGGYNAGRRRTGLRLTFHGGMPRSRFGRLAAGLAFLLILLVGWFGGGIAHEMILHDGRFILSDESAISVEGNRHLSRAQTLDVFSGDIGRNILRVSPAERKADLERLPWVKRATVMRLLPDHLNIKVEERTPVAFVRQGGHIGLVDGSGVLLTPGSGRGETTHYSFPVVTGLAPEDPLSVRSARMMLFREFTGALDATGDKISARLSEIDLSNPEDVRALIPDHGADVLVHFGDSDYLDRFRKYEAHLAEWRGQYPKLSSVDMRYERQVVLEMQPGTAVPLAGAAQDTAGPTGTATDVQTGPHTSLKSSAAARAAHVATKPRVPAPVLRKAGHP